MPEGYALDRPGALSCPECGGTTRREHEQGLLRYRCHIGHVLTGEALLHAQFTMLEHHLGACLALLNERAELCSQLGEAAGKGLGETSLLDAAREEALARAQVLRTLLEDRWVVPQGPARG